MNRRLAITLSRTITIFVIVIVLIAVTVSRQGANTFNVTMDRYDTNRTGANTHETILTTSNVNPARFGKLFARTVIGDIYAQPLYVSALNILGKGTHNVVLVATMHNNVYAFDADDPSQSAPLWEANLGPSFLTDDTDIWDGEVGILGTPVIDLKTNTLYLVSIGLEGSPSTSAVHRIHALDLSTGQEKFSGPAAIQAIVPGTGDDSLNGQVAFDAKQQLQRPGLVLANGRVYAAFGSIQNRDPYHGWLIGFTADDLSRAPLVWNTTPNARKGGIWQAGTAPIVDGAGNIYLVTGNGTFTAIDGGADYGDSFVRLSTANNQLVPVDYFTPFAQDLYSKGDIDVGSSGAVMIPGTSLVLGGGKDGQLYLVDGNAMGHYNSFNNNQVKQAFVAYSGVLGDAPILWNGPTNMHIFVWGEQDHLKDYLFTNGQIQAKPAHQSPFSTLWQPGAVLSISSDGSKPGTGILWAIQSSAPSAPTSGQTGVLRALDATAVDHELWNSDMNGERDRLGNVAKYNAPVVANGKVYVGTFSNQLVVYGLRPIPATPIPPVTLAPSGTGTGLTAEYFGDESLKSLLVTRVDANPNFNWGTGSPDPAVPDDDFSVRWSGQVQPLSTGYYTFYVSADDGARLWVNGIPLMDHWSGLDPNAEFSGTTFMTAGQKYDIKLEYFDDTLGAYVTLKWAGPGVPKSEIPTSQLYPAPG